MDDIPVAAQYSYIVYERSGMKGVTAAVIGWECAVTRYQAELLASEHHGLPVCDLLVLPKRYATADEWQQALEAQEEMEYEKRLSQTG